MYWDLTLISWLEDAPFPATLDELMDYAERQGAPEEVVENLEMLKGQDRTYNSLIDIWPELPTQSDYTDYSGEQDN